MAGKSAFQVEGVIVEALPNQTFRAELSNGHQILAYAVGRAKTMVAGLGPGAKIQLQLSPFDLSQGRIVVEPKTI